MSSKATRGVFPWKGPASVGDGRAAAYVRQNGALPRARTGLVSTGASAWAFADEDLHAASRPRAGWGGRSEYRGGTHRPRRSGTVGTEQGLGTRTRVTGRRGADEYAAHDSQGTWHTSIVPRDSDDQRLVRKEREMRKELLAQYHPARTVRRMRGPSAALVAVRKELRRRAKVKHARDQDGRKYWQVMNDRNEIIHPIEEHHSSSSSGSGSETSESDDDDDALYARRAAAAEAAESASLGAPTFEDGAPNYGTWDPRKRPVVPADPLGLHTQRRKQQQQQQTRRGGHARQHKAARVRGRGSSQRGATAPAASAAAPAATAVVAARVVAGRMYAVARCGGSSRAAEQSYCSVHRGGSLGARVAAQPVPTRVTYAAACGATVIVLHIIVRARRGGDSKKSRVRIVELPPVAGKLRVGDELALPSRMLRGVAPRQSLNVWRRVTSKNLRSVEDVGLRLVVLGGAVLSTDIHEETLSRCEGRAMDSAVATLRDEIKAGGGAVSDVALAEYEPIAMPPMRTARQACAATAATFAALPRRGGLLTQSTLLQPASASTNVASSAAGWARAPVAGIIAVVGGLGAGTGGRVGVLKFLRSGEILDLRALRMRRLGVGPGAVRSSAAHFIPRSMRCAQANRVCAVPTHVADWKPLPPMHEARAGCQLLAIDDGTTFHDDHDGLSRTGSSSLQGEGVTDRLIVIGGLAPEKSGRREEGNDDLFGAARILASSEVLRISGDGAARGWNIDAVPAMRRARADFVAVWARGIGIIVVGGTGQAPMEKVEGEEGGAAATALKRALREECLACCEVLPFSVHKESDDGGGSEGGAMASLAWQALAPLPYPRSHCAGALLTLPATLKSGGGGGGEVMAPSYSSSSSPALVVAGGFDASGVATKTCAYLDVRANTWVSLPSMNKARARCSGAVFAGCFVVTGGQDEHGVGLEDCEAFDLFTQAWTMVPNMRLSEPTAAHCAVAVL